MHKTNKTNITLSFQNNNLKLKLFIHNLIEPNIKNQTFLSENKLTKEFLCQRYKVSISP